MKNYYEHEIEVRFTEGILSKSTDWQWFVDYTEANISAPKEMHNIREFSSCFGAARFTFGHFARLIDFGEPGNLSFSLEWTRRTYDAALVRSGKKEFEDALTGDHFFDALCFIAFSTKILNSVQERSFSQNSELLFSSNLFQVYDLSSLEAEGTRLIAAVEVSGIPGIEKSAEILKSNFSSVETEINETFVSGILDSYFDADFLDFKNPDGRFFQTWQEVLFLELFRTSFTMDGLKPMIGYRDGSGNPDVTAWTPEKIALAKTAFSDSRAICIFETVAYALHNTPVSIGTQKILSDLCASQIEACLASQQNLRAAECTALLVTEKMLNEDSMDSQVKKEHKERIGRALSDISDPSDIEYALNHSLPITKKQIETYGKSIQDAAKNALRDIKTTSDLLSFFADARIPAHCTDEDARMALDLFVEQIKSVDALTAELFYSAMLFYIELLSNPEVDNSWVKSVLIDLKNVWTTHYYNAVSASMKCISVSGAIPSEAVKAHNELLLNSPDQFAMQVFSFSEDSMMRCFESVASRPLFALAKKVSVSEYYPDHLHVLADDKHKIDCMIINELNTVWSKKAYRFQNDIEEQPRTDAFYEDLNSNISFAIQFVDARKPYERIARMLSGQYELLPYPEDHALLGHVTQFFPILENIIRKIGEWFLVVPFQADKEKFNVLKEVSGILATIVAELSEDAQTLQGLNEFLLVNHVMYSSNGPNVRNECAHGRLYQDSNGIATAFKMTVVCTYIMLTRLEILNSSNLAEEVSVLNPNEPDDSL